MDNDDFQERLMPGERIVWSGRPATGLMFTARDAYMIPFSLLWGGFAIFWEWSVLSQANAPSFFGLWGIPFVAIGIYFVVGRFFADAWLRTRMRYAVTGQRILILRLPPFGNFTTFAIDRLPTLSLTEREDGRGTIKFQEMQTLAWQRRGASFGGMTPALDNTQFLAIPDARNVFSQIQRLSAAKSF